MSPGEFELLRSDYLKESVKDRIMDIKAGNTAVAKRIANTVLYERNVVVKKVNLKDYQMLLIKIITTECTRN
jgi:hypothetical protein